ncbi:Nucleotidyltransferase [uncultured Candidatus Thioglobus sp.]|nr:Nucleotidyltransferase [uncultured Candidatus Thioglobus sp.]
MKDDIRYLQRFENFEKSFKLLQQALAIKTPTIIEKAGAIQFFESSFELSWKLMKDYLDFSGYSVNSPRNAIKQAFSMGIINNGDLWLDALNDRNLTVHTYDEAMANEVFNKTKEEYYDLLLQLYTEFKKKSCSD